MSSIVVNTGGQNRRKTFAPAMPPERMIRVKISVPTYPVGTTAFFHAATAASLLYAKTGILSSKISAASRASRFSTFHPKSPIIPQPTPIHHQFAARARQIPKKDPGENVLFPKISGTFSPLYPEKMASRRGLSQKNLKISPVDGAPAACYNRGASFPAAIDRAAGGRAKIWKNGGTASCRIRQPSVSAPSGDNICGARFARPQKAGRSI